MGQKENRPMPQGNLRHSSGELGASKRNELWREGMGELHRHLLVLVLEAIDANVQNQSTHPFVSRPLFFPLNPPLLITF